MNRLIITSLFLIIQSVSGSDYNIEPCVHKISGSFYLEPNDTLKEDLSVSGGNVTIDGVVEGDIAVMGGSLIINGIVDGDVAVFGGEIENNGRITGDAAVAGGSVKNKNSVEGDIAVAGGTVILDSGSVVEGDIAIVGGSVERSDYAKIKGEITALDIGKLDRIMPRISNLLKLRRGFQPVGNFALTSFAFAVVIYFLNLICLLIFPGAVEKITQRIKENVWIGIAIGIGIEILFVPLIILFAISIIGIPIIPAFILALFIGMVFGISAFSVVLGERITTGLNWKISNKVGLFTIGWLGIMIIPIIGILLKNLGLPGLFIWLLGISILYVAFTIGLGGVLYALIKRKG